jgi:hypothetical protein
MGLADAKTKPSLFSLLTILLAAITKGQKDSRSRVAVGKTTEVVAKCAQQVIEQISSQIKAKLSPKKAIEKSNGVRSSILHKVKFTIVIIQVKLITFCQMEDLTL